MGTPQASDAVLVEMIRSNCDTVSHERLSLWMGRDESKIKRFVERHNAFFFEDITQESFWIGYRNIRSGKYTQQEGASLTSYLFGIAGRRVIALNRKLDNCHQPLEDVDNQGEAKELQVEDLKQADQIEEVEKQLDLIPRIKLMVNAFFTKLSTQDQRILLSKYDEGMDSKEIGKKFGMTNGNVRQRQYRALLALKAEMESAGE